MSAALACTDSIRPKASASFYLNDHLTGGVIILFPTITLLLYQMNQRTIPPPPSDVCVCLIGTKK